SYARSNVRRLLSRARSTTSPRPSRPSPADFPEPTVSTTPANHSALTPLRFLERSAEVFPDKTAVLHGERSYTYAQFADETQALAAALARDVAPGERVAVLTPNV